MVSYRKLLNGLIVFSVLVFLAVGVQAQEVQQFKVQGTVTNAKTGDPMIGVNILVKGTTKGTTTNKNGEYSLLVPSAQDSLRFSFIGFKTKTVPIDGRQLINISLKENVITGQQVVVTAFGEKRSKMSVVGAVSSIISPSTSLKIPTNSLTNSFAGRIAGVIAYNRSGQPGANSSRFYIRGISTFSGSVNPLIIIDGVPSSVSDLNALSPSVIESFSILKDATATAVYGSRGANGVMIVTTKSGQNLGNPRIKLRMENSFNSPIGVTQFADGVTFMKLYNQAVRLGGSGQTPYSQQKIKGTRLERNKYVFPNVDWYDKLFKNYSMRHNVNLTVTGGGKKLQYFLSGTYEKSNGMLKSYDLNSYSNNVQFNRYAFQNNLNVNLTPNTQVSLKLNTTLETRHGPSYATSAVFDRVMDSNPVDFPAIFPNRPNGKYKGIQLFGTKGGGRYNSGYRNPFALMTSGYWNQFRTTVRARVQLHQNLKFLAKGLEVRAIAAFKNYSVNSVSRSRGFNHYQVSNYNIIDPDSLTYTLRRVGTQQDLTLGTGTTVNGDRQMYFQVRFNYEKQLTENQHISVMALAQQTNQDSNAPTDLISSLPVRHRGVAGRFTYKFNNTYIAEFDFGYNGTAAFAAGHRYGFFPAYGLGIVLSNENFWEPIKDVVNYFKVRATFGLVGNDQIGSARYAYLSSIDLGGLGYTTGRSLGYGRNGYLINRAANRGLHWEIGRKWNLGFNMTLFHSLHITANFYKQDRHGIFLSRKTLPASFGLHGTDIFGNLGKVKNKGMDLKVKFSHAFSSDFFVAFKGTFTYAHNTITAQDEPPFLQNPNLSAVGHPVHSLLALKAQRLFIDQAEINHSSEQELGGKVKPGDIKYLDYNGDGIINGDDRVHMGYPTTPEILYGFGPSFKYKNFDLSFLFQGVAHRSIMMSGFDPFGSSAVRNVMQFIVNDHWSRRNQDIYATYPRLSINTNANNTTNSSWWLRSGSYIRLKYAELGYSFWQGDARVYISAHNLFELSPFKLWDPELSGPYGNSNGLGYPLQRTVNIGIQFTF